MSSNSNRIPSSPITIKVTIFILIAAISFICFLPDLNNGFLFAWDDNFYIAENDHIKELSAEMIRWAFTDFYASNWHPLTWISLAMDYAVWGLNPLGYHLTNNLLHAINAGMFFMTCLALLKSYLNALPPESRQLSILTTNRAIYCSMLAAFFFAVHPLRVESVAWVSERKDVLSVFFGLPAILFYLKYAERPGLTDRYSSFPFSRYYWLSIIFFSLSILSKAMLVTLPTVLLLLDWFPLKRLKRSSLIKMVSEKVPFIVISCIGAVITVSAQSSAMIPIDVLSLSSRLQIASKSIMTYLWMTAWPLNLSPFYLHPGNITGLRFEYILPMVMFLSVTACCTMLVKRRPLLITAWMIYLITLLPVIGIISIGATEMADRYTYVPSLPVALVAALAIITAIARLSRSRLAVMSITTVTLLLLVGASYLTVRQISYWKDDVALWSRAIEVKPHFSGRMYFERGKSYSARGDYLKALEDTDEALAIATRKRHREMHTIFVQRAQILLKMEDLNGAIATYTRAIESDTSSARSMYYFERGKLYQEVGRPDLAAEDFKLADGGK